jgi:hypothetical protein
MARNIDCPACLVGLISSDERTNGLVHYGADLTLNASEMAQDRRVAQPAY